MSNTRYGIESVRSAIGTGRYEHDFGLFRKELILALMVEFDKPPDPMAAVVDRAVESVVDGRTVPTSKSHVPAVHLRQIADGAFAHVNESDDPDRCYVLCHAAGPALSKPRLFTGKAAAQDAMAAEWAKARKIEIDDGYNLSPRDQMLAISFDLWESGDRSAQFRSMNAWTGDANERQSWHIFEIRTSERNDAEPGKRGSA